LARHLALFFLALAGLSTSACNKKPTPDPTPGAQPSASAAALPLASASASASAVSPGEVPVLRPEQIVKLGELPVYLRPIEGALMVSMGDKLGRLEGNRVEWVRTFKTNNEPGLDNFYINSVSGRWPDKVGIGFTDGHSREPHVGFLFLQDQKETFPFRSDGGVHFFVAHGRVKDSSFLAFTANGSSYFRTVEGPKLGHQNIQYKEARCTEEEIGAALPDTNAVIPSDMEGLPSGEMLAVGSLCRVRGMAAEVWDKGIKSRIVPLDRWFKKESNLKILRGPSDDLLIYARWSSSTILRYKQGVIEPMPSPGSSVEQLFLSDKGQLHAFDGKEIFRFEQERWAPVARLAWSSFLGDLILRDGVFLYGSQGSINRLVPGESIEFREGCKTPFVYVYDVDPRNDRKYTFPSTRKALSSFAEAEQLELVEFDEGRFRLGIVVTSKAQGEAVLAHLKTTMKNEKPQLLCYEPRQPRKIALSKKP